MEVNYQDKPAWRLTSFYGFSERHRSKDSKNLLQSLSQDTNLPWCITGDFNDLFLTEDKKGHIDYPIWLMRGFKEVVSNVNLVDIPI